MKKYLFTLGVLTISITANSQVLTHVGDAGLFYVGEGALVYSGGGVQTKADGKIDIHGNFMLKGVPGDYFKTLDASGADKTYAAGGNNIILRMNVPAGSPVGTFPTVNSTYGQLSIEGLGQVTITGIVNKEYLTAKHGNGNFYQQIAIPFFDKELNSLSTEFAKTFSTTRYSKNEILKWTNTTAVSDNTGPLSTKTSNPIEYFMLGSNNNNLDTSTPPATMATLAPSPTGSVYTLKGMPYADGIVGGTINGSLQNAGAGINYGTGGFATNSYNEYYNTYLQDQFEATATPWAGTFGKNIYQFGNPFFTNIDLSKIGYTEIGSVTDDNQVSNIWGVRYSPGTVISLSSGSTYSVGAQIQTYQPSTHPTMPGFPVGDTGLLVKPLQTFVLKLRNSTAVPDLKFNKLRRFKYDVRADGTSYAITANKNGLSTSTKQLGIIALNAAGEEIGRTYYVVCSTCTSGFQTSTATTLQAASSAGVIKSFEEDPINGMYDYNQTNHALYINEANEVNFKGKPIPVALYNSDIASLKFDIKENGIQLTDGEQNLSTGIGFHYRTSAGVLGNVEQNATIPVNGITEYGFSYGPMTNSTLGTTETTKANRTLVVYNEAIDNYVVQFDPSWKSADVQVYDMSGKIVISAKNVKTSQDFVINLSNKIQGTYIVTGVNEKGEKFTSKIIR